MCYPIGARLAQPCILALEKLYHHLFSTPGHDTTTIDQLKQDLVQWLTHHSFEELPDALKYYLADPNSDLEGNLAHLTFLDPWGVQVNIHPLVTIYINTLLAWAKCFLATYGVYPGLYDLLDTPRHDFLAAQLHLRDYTLPRPFLHRSRGPPTLKCEYEALQPHLAPPPTPDSLDICRMTCPSFNTSVCHATSPSVIPPAPTVCLSLCKSVTLSVCATDSPSIISVHLSYPQSVHPPVTPAKHPSDCPSQSDHLYTILPCPSGCPTSSDSTSTTYTSLSDHPPPSHHLYDTPIRPSACSSPVDCLTATTTHPPVCPSSPTIHHTQDSSQSLAVVNGEQSHTIHRTQDLSQSLAVVNGEQSRKAKKFHRALTTYDLLLRALDASRIYLHDLRRVAPPKSGEDAHVTHGKCDFGGATLNNHSLGFIYVLPRLWDPGGVRSSPNVPRDRSRALAPSRYPYGPRMGHLVNLPSLRQWRDLHMSHVKLDIFLWEYYWSQSRHEENY